jgi:hypothetical protein
MELRIAFYNRRKVMRVFAGPQRPSQGQETLHNSANSILQRQPRQPLLQATPSAADHYPAPSPMDDTGPLTNVTKDNWEEIKEYLDEHKGGYGGLWSSYRAVEVHENFHWVTAWQEEFKKDLQEAELTWRKSKLVSPGLRRQRMPRSPFGARRRKFLKTPSYAPSTTARI